MSTNAPSVSIHVSVIQSECTNMFQQYFKMFKHYLKDVWLISCLISCFQIYSRTRKPIQKTEMNQNQPWRRLTPQPPQALSSHPPNTVWLAMGAGQPWALPLLCWQHWQLCGTIPCSCIALQMLCWCSCSLSLIPAALPNRNKWKWLLVDVIC